LVRLWPRSSHRRMQADAVAAAGVDAGFGDWTM
jgi:hypothetical protein